MCCCPHFPDEKSSCAERFLDAVDHRVDTGTQTDSQPTALTTKLFCKHSKIISVEHSFLLFLASSDQHPTTHIIILLEVLAQLF